MTVVFGLLVLGLLGLIGFGTWERGERERELRTLLSSLAEQVAKPPVIVPSAPVPPAPDLAAMVKEMGEAFAKNLAGYGQPAYSPPTVEEMMAGVSRPFTRRQFIPDVEQDPFMFADLDPSMVGETVPVRGGWFSTPHGPAPNGYAPTDDGSVQRTDGQEMFRSGEGAPPPAGGEE